MACDIVTCALVTYIREEQPMPTYQYECSGCGHNFEILQSMSENRLKTCPECGRRALTRLIGTGSGIIFKGSGFYETDYKRKTPALHRDGAGQPKSDAQEDSGRKSPKASSDKSSHGCSPQCGCAV